MLSLLLLLLIWLWRCCRFSVLHMNTLPSSVTILYATYSIMPQCYKNCAISVAPHSLWLSIFTGWNKTLHGTRSTWRSHQLHKGVIFVHWYVCLCSGSLGVDVQMYCCWWWANLWILYQYISQMAAHLPGSLLKLTLYTITSVLIFFRLFFMHFLRCWQVKIRVAIKASWVGDHFSYCHDDIKWCGNIAAKRN